MSTNASVTELPPTFDPASVESALYKEWEDAGLFTADASRSRRAGGNRDPFVIVMPPPNVTAVLHMGHGLNNTVQDVLVRWRRMCGDEALWLPGTDHAGIATQNVIESSSPAKARHASTSDETHSFSALQTSSPKLAGLFSSSFARSARRATGLEPLTRCRRSFRERCAKRSCRCTSGVSSIADTA